MLKKNRAAERLQKIAGEALAIIPLTPNQWTALSVLVAGVGFLSLVYHDALLATGLFLLAVAIDAIDGAVARAKCMESRKGAFIDGICDRFVEAFALFGLMFYGLPGVYLTADVWLALLLFFGTCMTTFVRAYAEHRKLLDAQQTGKMPGGVFERAERVLLILAVILLAHYNPLYAVYLLILGCGLAIVTVGQRLVYALSF